MTKLYLDIIATSEVKLTSGASFRVSNTGEIDLWCVVGSEPSTQTRSPVAQLFSAYQLNNGVNFQLSVTTVSMAVNERIRFTFYCNYQQKNITAACTYLNGLKGSVKLIVTGPQGYKYFETNVTGTAT